MNGHESLGGAQVTYSRSNVPQTGCHGTHGGCQIRHKQHKYNGTNKEDKHVKHEECKHIVYNFGIN